MIYKESEKSMESINKILTEEYGIDNIISIEKTLQGSGNSYLINTPNLKYFLKTNERNDFIEIYFKILSENILTLPKIIPTKNNLLITLDKMVLYEYIEGKVYDILNPAQQFNIIQYLRKFNSLLKSISIERKSIRILNHWDMISDINYLTEDFLEVIKDLDYEYKNTIIEGINLLKKYKKLILTDYQLIHSDLGPDNIIFSESNLVISVIDFTPTFDHPLFSLSQFFYWQYLWVGRNITIDDIKKILIEYLEDDFTLEKELIFLVLLVKSCIFRTAGLLLHLMNNNQDFGKLKKRIDILKKIIILLQENGII